jgi:hypothetical protein
MNKVHTIKSDKKKEYREWYKRGVRDGRKQVVEGIISAMGLDYNSFEHDPLSEVGIDEEFDSHFTIAQLNRDKTP